MKFSILAILSLNLVSAIAVAPTKQKSKAESECSLVECIVTLGELPLSISACAETIDDFNDLSDDRDVLKLVGHAADCITEAALAIAELPEHCGGCLSELLNGE